jgi:hypothetical protein
VRGWVAGFFDRASCPDEKLAGIHAGHPSGYSSTHPPRHTGTPRIKSHIKSRTTPGAAGSGKCFVGAHLCATNRRSGTSIWCGRAQVRSYKESRRPVSIGSLWERTLCATNLRSGTPRRGCRAQGALPQTSGRGSKMERCLKPMRSEAPL